MFEKRLFLEQNEEELHLSTLLRKFSPMEESVLNYLIIHLHKEINFD
jgi:hypothetical protein